MTKTAEMLLHVDAEKALAAMTVHELDWWHIVLMVTGAVFWIVLFCGGLLYLATKDNPPPPDTPDFVVCTCPTFLNNTTNANHTAVPDITTWTRRNPKCPIHSTARQENA